MFGISSLSPMADKPNKGPKKEGTVTNTKIEESFVKKRLSSSLLSSSPSSSSGASSVDKKNESRSPIITRSRSRNIEDRASAADFQSSGAITSSRGSKRPKTSTVTSVNQKRIKVSPTPDTTSKATNFVESKTRTTTRKQANQKPVVSSESDSRKHKRSNIEATSEKRSKKRSSKDDNNNSQSKTANFTSSTSATKESRKKISSALSSRSLSLGDRNYFFNLSLLNMDNNGTNYPSITNNLSQSSTAAASQNTSQVSQNTNLSNGNTSTISTNSQNSDTSANNIAGSNSIYTRSYGIIAQTSADNENEEIEMNRLQSILESRGIHQHILGIPRVQNLFYRSLNSSSNTKAQQLLDALNSASNDSEKLQCVLEMCQILLMGNEDTLVGFPIKTVVPTLINLLSMEHNFEIMHHACRALTYMMESLPRSSAAVLDAVPVFLEKLQVIQCMDVAEQSLSALEMLSRRHNKAILHARGVSACLTYLDFFSIDAKRSAITITANCFQNLSLDDFQYVQDSLPILSSHLTIDDKKCIESICLAFYRLVECYQNDCVIVSEIASTELLTNIQSVLMYSPPILSTTSFVNVIRMLSIMCFSCSKIAVELMKLNICETLKCLLLCSDNVKEKSETMNLISRSPQEICELTSFIAELMPSLPLSGIFSIDVLFSKANPMSSEVPVWQWKDDRGFWQTFNVVDNKIIESAHQSGEEELELNGMGKSYIINFNSMQRVCEETASTCPVQRKINTFSNSELLSRSNLQSIDPRTEFIYNEPELASNFIKFVFKVLYEVYNNSAGYSVRYKCLNAILRIIYYTPKELLQSILEDQSISSSIATMLASNDTRMIVCAVQMCNILMEKIPEIFSIYFQREGVIHQLRKLYLDESRFNDLIRDNIIEKNSANNILCPQTWMLENAQMILNRRNEFSSLDPCLTNFTPITSPQNVSSSKSNSSKQATTTQNTDQPSGRNDDILKRKRTRKGTAFSNSRSSSINYTDTIDHISSESVDLSSLSAAYLGNLPFLVSETISSANLNINNHKNSTRLGSSKDFLQRFNPTRWARWSQSSVSPNPHVIPTTSNVTTKDLTSIQKSSNNDKEKLRSWIKEQSKIFDEKYFLKTGQNDKGIHFSSNILNDLRDAINLLKPNSSKGLIMIKNILLESDLSSFELIHSGLVKNLLNYLISNEDSLEKRENNIRTFLHSIVGAPQSDLTENIDEMNFDPKPFSILVSKLNACVSQLEQFPLRVQDYHTISSRGSHPFKYFSSHFKISLNCHPSCTNLKKFKPTILRMEPFTTIESIERYLLDKGYGKVKDNDYDLSDEEFSDEESPDITMSSSSQIQSKHRLQLLIGEHVLPYNLSLYQAIKQAMSNDLDHDSDDGHIFGSKFWNSTFCIYYRLATDTNTSSSSSAVAVSSTTSCRSSRKSKSKSIVKKKDELWIEGKVPKSVSALNSYLKNNVSINSSTNDQSAEVITLLRVLYGINRYWGHLYKFSHIFKPLIPLKEFVNTKLTVKANRQLQDPVVIMTGTLPSWLSELAYACPFMLPFEIRYLLFSVACFDRDRALHRLFENTPDLSLDSRERLFVPRIEKKRKIISRNDIFKSAESLFNDHYNSKSMLEIQYENEVGTGLGPTLEFYALVSKEFQRAELEMWRGDVLTTNLKNEKADPVNYIYSNNGLFPLPISRSNKSSAATKIKHRFKLLGKFMAKALLDSRMVDINLNVLFYKWLLDEETTFSVYDLYYLDFAFFSSISQMYRIAQRKSKLTVSNNSDLLKLHGSSIEDLNIDFIMPGYPHIELRKGGKDLPVTLNNLENYIELVSHWSLLEGVSKQMEAFKEGFNSVFELSHLKLFYAEELQQLFCGSNYKRWDQKMLMESCKIDHGFTYESRAIKFLFEILSSYNDEEQRKFLQFLTGFPRLPIGGFKSLNPPFTIVKKSQSESDNPNCLPSVMTCVNYLKLPDYPTIEMMRDKLFIAISEGQFSFHLS